jgi:hypothetical protein
MGSPAVLRALASCTLAAWAVSAVADEDPAPAPAGTVGLDPSLLERSDLIVVGRVGWLKRGIGGAQHVARIDVEKPLRGDPGSEAVTVFVGGPSSGASARLRGRLEGEEGRRVVLFLAKTRAGSGFEIEALFSAEPPEGPEKATVLEREIGLAEVPDPAERRRLQASAYLDILARGGSWGRLHASAQLATLARLDPEAFPDSARAEIADALARAASPKLRTRLETTLDRLGPAPSRPAELPGLVRPAAPVGGEAILRRHWKEAQGEEARVLALTSLVREAKERAVPDLLEAAVDASPKVRERAAFLLGDLRSADGVRLLRERFAAEPDAAVREAIVRAVGLYGDAGSVPWLAERSREPATLRPALYALARVGGAEAGAALAAAREAALACETPDRTIATLVDYLRGPEFREAERRAGRLVTESPAPEGAR